MCSQALSTGPVLPPLFASVLTESRSRHPASDAGGMCARLREHHLKPSNSNRKIFPFPPSLFFIFFHPWMEKRSSCNAAAVVHANCFSHRLGLFLVAREKMTNRKKKKKTRPIDSILTALLCFSSRQTVGCAAAPTLSLLLLVTGTASPSFFFFFLFLPARN